MARLGKRGSNPGGVLSTQEAATILGVSHPTLLKLLKEKKVPEPQKVGRVRQWNRSDLEQARVMLTRLYQERGLRRGRGARE